jgi:hypothetical protein
VQALRITIRYLVEWYRLVLKGRRQQQAQTSAPLTPVDPWQPQSYRLELEGVIFTSVFNPYDGRKIGAIWFRLFVMPSGIAMTSYLSAN